MFIKQGIKLMTTTIPTTELLSIDKLAVLNEEHYRTIFAIYGTKGTNRYKELFIGTGNIDLETCASVLTMWISDDKDEERRKKLIKSINENYEQHIEEEARLKLLKYEVTEATKNKTKHQRKITRRENDFTKTLTKSFLNTDELGNGLKQAEADAKLQRALEKRERLRKRGRIAYLKGVVAAVIDNQHKEYMKETNEKAEEIVKAAEAVIANSDSKTMAGTNEVFSSLSEYFEDKDEIYNLGAEVIKTDINELINDNTDESSTPLEAPKKKSDRPAGFGNQ